MPNPMEKRRLRVFLDSNVIISGLFLERGAPCITLDILSLNLPVLTPVTGAYNIKEVERNLAAKLPAVLPLFRSCLRTVGFEIVPLPEHKNLASLAGLTSEMDLPVLASAFLGEVDFLVTGDKREMLKIRKHNLPFTILSPAEFLDEYLPEWLKKL